MMRLLSLFLVVLGLWIVPLCAGDFQVPIVNDDTSRGPPASAYSTPLDDRFEKLALRTLEHFKTPGLAVAVVRGNQTFIKGYGVSEISTLKPVTEHTHFIAGSTTKAFTAAAVSLLVDDNVNYPEIQWDTPVHSIIPDDFILNDNWYTTHVTIEDALSHRSGLPRHDYAWHYANSSQRDAVRKMRHLPLTAPIRTKFQYCNLMYVSIAHLIETVTGQGLGDFLHERIWEPLGMNETYMSIADAEVSGAEISHGYAVNRTGEIEKVGHYAWDQVRGAGNIVSSAADYAKWIRAMIERAPPMSPEGHAALVCSHSITQPAIEPPESAPVTYGFGWQIHSYRGEILLEHSGLQPGFGTWVWYLPNRSLGMVLFANNEMGGNAAQMVLAHHLIDELLGTPEEERFDWVSRAEKAIKAIRNPKITPGMLHDLYPSLPDPPLPLPADPSVYEGLYTHPAYPTLNITSNCPESAMLPPFPYNTPPSKTLKICVYSDLQDWKKQPAELVHVSGDFWVFGAELWGQPLLASVECRLSPQGSTSHIGVQFEPEMTAKGERIWYQRADN